MSQKPTAKGVIKPQTTWTGKSPDHAGVVVVIDPGLRTQTVIVVENPLAALAWAQQITRSAEEQIARSSPVRIEHNEAQFAVVERLSGRRLDS
jgi:hypothetical protein